jgi:hypothetical protein
LDDAGLARRRCRIPQERSSLMSGSNCEQIREYGSEVHTRRAALAALASGIGALTWQETDARRKRRRRGHQRAKAAAKGGASQRPIADFLDAQGTTNDFIFPIPDFVGWASNPPDPTTRFASVDYAGLANAYLVGEGYPDLGTTMSGKVTEQALKDGRAEVSVVLHTKNALSWALTLTNFDVANDPLSFGYRPGELLDPNNVGLSPALGDSQFSVVFNNTAPGAPLPDLITAFILGGAEPGQELLKLSFRASASGLLREPSEYPEGTPGHLTIVQTGLVYKFTSSEQPPHPAVADGFPAEKVEWKKVGAGTTKS